MEEHLKATVSDDDTDDDETDGTGLSQSRASLIQTSFFSSHSGKMFTPINLTAESTEYSFRKFEGRLWNDALQQSQGCHGLDWTDMFERGKAQSVVWNEVVLRQDQGITDATLYSLMKNKESLKDVTTVDVSGCVHLTDVGIHWLALMLPFCPSLKKINLDGCREITERSLLSLGCHGNGLTVSAQGTGVMFSPVSLMKSNSYFHLDGCPLVDAVSFPDDTEQGIHVSGHLVICSGAGHNYSVADYLASNKQIEFHGLVHIKAWKAEDCLFNVVETSLSLPSAAVLIPASVTQVIIPCDTNTDREETKNHIVSTLTHFLSKEVYLERADPVTSYTRSWSVGPLVGAEVEDSTGVVEILHKINVSSMQMPNFTTLEPLSKLRPYFEIELLHAGIDDTLTEVSVSIGVRCRPYFPKPLITSRHTHTKKTMKVGDRLGIGVENINMLADTYLAEGSYVQLYGRLNKETFHLPEFTWYGDGCPFVHILSPGARFKIVNYQGCSEECWKLLFKEEHKKQIAEGRYFSPSELNTGCIMDVPSQVLSYASMRTATTNNCPVALCRMKESLSRDHCEFAVKILTCAEQCCITVGVISELCFKEPPGSQAGTIGYSAIDGRIRAGSQTTADVSTTNTEDCTCHVGDIMKVKVGGFTSKYAQPGDMLHVSFYKNDSMVGEREWRYDVTEGLQGRLLPAVSLQAPGEQVVLLNCVSLPDYEISHLMERASKEKFLLKGTSFLKLQEHQLECIRDLSDSMADITNFKAANSLTREHFHFEVRLSHIGKKREMGIGLVHGNYRVERMPGWEEGSIGWHFERGKVFVEQNKGVEEITAEAYQGDIVGCGFDITDVTFDDTGVPKCNQTLRVYFTRNGGEVLRQEFHYRGGGLHPAIGMSSLGSKVELMNLLDPLVFEGNQSTNPDTSGGVRFVVAVSGSGPVDTILHDVEESLNRISADLEQQEDNFARKSTVTMNDHRQFAQLVRGRENLTRFLTHRGVRFKVLQLNMATGEGRTELVSAIVANQRSAELWQPYQYGHWHDVQVVGEVIQSLSDRQPVVSVEELCGQLHQQFSGQSARLDRVLTMLYNSGQIIYIPELQPNLIVTDVGWFVDTLTRLCHDSGDTMTSDTVTCVVSPTSAWSDKSLLKLKVDNLEHLLKWMLATHQMLHIVPPRRLVTDERFFLIHPPSLPTTPEAALLEKFWRGIDDSEEHVLKTRKRFSFPFGFTHHAFFIAMAACTRFCKPLLLWQQGLVWHQGAVEMVLILQSDVGNKADVYLQGKCLLLPAEGSSVESSASNVRKHLLSVFHLYDDIVQFVFAKLQLSVFTESSSDITDENTAICSQHSWLQSSDNKLITVCTICNNCSENGLSCNHNGIMGTNYRCCECHTQQACCRNCGICHRCAEEFWEIKSFLRPQLWHSENDTEKITLTSGAIRHITMATLNVETVNEVTLTVPPGDDGKLDLNVCLLSSDRQTLIDAFPGQATICSPEEDFLEGVRSWWKTVYVEEGLGLKPWDSVQIRLRNCQPKCRGKIATMASQDHETAKACTSETDGTSQCAFHMCRNVRVWPSRRIIGYADSGSGGTPLGILIGASLISPPHVYFEFEILRTGNEGSLGIGIVPDDYPDDTVPGMTANSVALVTDQKGIFMGGLKKSDCPSCHVGDKLGCRVTFDDMNEMTVSFSYNGEQIWQGAYDPAEMAVRPAISLQGKGDVIQLLEYHHAWCVVRKESSHENPGIYVDDHIRIRPSEVLVFAGKTAEVHLESQTSVAVLYKIQVSNEDRYIVQPKVMGVLGATTRATVLTVSVISGSDMDVRGDKLKILWTDIEDGEMNKDVEELWKVVAAANKKTYSRVLTCEGQEHLEYADNLDPSLVPLTSTGPPTQASCCLEILRNGRPVNEYYVPRADYHLVMEGYTLPFVNFPKSPRCARPDAVSESEHINIDKSCTDQTSHFTVLEANLAHLSPRLKTWDGPKEQDVDLSYICVFLPGELSSRNVLLYPSLQDLTPSGGLAVHQLCKSLETKQLQHSDTVYNRLHFVDAKGIVPEKPVPVEYIVSDLVAAWAYAELSTTQLMLPCYEQLLGQLAGRLSRDQVENAFLYILSRYTALCHLSSIKHGSLPMMPCHTNHASVIQRSLPVTSANFDDTSSNFSSSGFDDDDFEFNDPSKIIGGLCKAHDNTKLAAELRHCQFDLSLVEPYGELLSVLEYDIQDVEELPDELPSTLNRLEVLELQSAQSLRTFAASIGAMKHVRKIMLRKENHLCSLPPDIGECTMLEDLIIYRSHIDELPASLVKCGNLHRLAAHTMLLGKLPDGFGQLPHLVELNLSHNPLQSLPRGFGGLQTLKILKLSGVPLMPHKRYDLEQYQKWHKKFPQNCKILSEEVLLALFDKCDKDKTGELDDHQMAALNAYIFYMVPRLGHRAQDGDTAEGCLPDDIFELRNLEELELQYQAITTISSRIGQLRALRTLNLSHCLRLESLPGALGELLNLQTLRLKGCAVLSTPPVEVVSHGFEAVIAYLKKLAAGSTENWRTKLMLVGLGGAGKTSLLRALKAKSHKTRPLRKEDITDGIDITNWTVQREDATITYSTWDFAGQTVYYNTHQFFLSQRAVYLLLWTVRLGYEHAGLDFWLSSIQSHAPKAPIFVIGTHCDQVVKIDLPKAKLMKQYPQIKGFHFVSSTEGMGIAELETAIVDATSRENYMGEKVPTVYLKLEEKILAERKQGSGVVEWTKMRQLALQSGISDEKEIKSAVQFLHDLGTVQYFDNDFLREHIVINPQWIVDVMACIVSVKDSPIMDGYFRHSDIGQVWGTYPSHLHNWLLRLTEEFDLTFPLPDQPVNIIPCLLPQTEPEFSFLAEGDPLTMKETVMLYKFAYLPAGLFNRAQVRLFQFTNGEMIWKHGSLLTKNANRALVHQQSEKELMVRVRGPRPENFLFLLHEVLEGLIAESFQGVSYDFLIPCPDCLQKFGINDPCMFPASLIKLATDKNVPFLQCHKHFHTVSMPILQENLPPESSTDLDAQISDKMRILNDLRHDLSQDLFISYHPSNVPDEKGEQVNPLDVAADLEAEGYTCWKKEITESNLQDRTIALNDAKLLVVFMSREYEMDEAHRTMFLYAKDVLQKPFVIVTVGDDAWKDSELGCAIGPQEVYVNMKKIDLYKEKLEELKKIIHRKLESLRKDGMPLPCFISYSWSNSRSAVSRGTRHIDGALGAGDPRRIKEYIESKGIHCWLDTEQVGQSGLYRDISLGIKEASVIVACISEQYANSVNCMMELRFATCRLNKPVVFVVVGTGDEWLYGELGMLIERCRAPMINMQQESGDSTCEQLVALVNEKVEEADKMLEQRLPQKSASAPAAVISMSFHEEYELTQRKFLRHVSMLVVGMDTSLYPRLFLIDFSGHSESSYQRSESHMSASATLGQTTRDLRHVTWRDSGKSLDTVSTDWARQTFTVKLLCEHDKGWHCAEQELPLVGLSTSEKVKLVDNSAAFLARILILMKHSGINLNCMMGSDGDSFIYFVNKKCKETTEDFANAYNSLWKEIRAQDTNRNMGGLRRCHLPTGQIRWLCREHSEAAHIRVLSSDVAMAAAHKPMLSEEDRLLSRYINEYANAIEQWPALSAEEKNELLSASKHRIAPKLKISQVPKKLLKAPQKSISADDIDGNEKPDFARTLPLSKVTSRPVSPKLSTTLSWPGLAQDAISKEKLRQQAAARFGLQQQTSAACVIL